MKKLLFLIGFMFISVGVCQAGNWTSYPDMAGGEIADGDTFHIHDADDATSAKINEISFSVLKTALDAAGFYNAITDIQDASTAQKGVAQFNSDNFTAASGVITIKDAGVAPAELASTDFGDFTVAAGVASLDANTVDSAQYVDGSIDHEHAAADFISGMTNVTSTDLDYMIIWDNTDSSLKKVDMAEVRGGAGAGGDITAVGNAPTGPAFTADGLGTTLYFEGSVADGIELILTTDNPTGVDKTVTIPATLDAYTVLDATICTDIEGTALSITAGTLNVTETDPNVDTEAEIEAITGALFGTSKAVTSGYIWVADGTDFESVAMSSDVTIASGGAVTIANNAVALTTDTTGNYVASITNGTGITGGDGGSEGAALTIAATLGTTITTGEITDDEILEADLDVTNSPTDNYVLSYDLATLGFTWVSSGAFTAWDDMTAPDANEALDMTGFYTEWDFGDTDHDMLTLFATEAFGDYSVMRIEQKTGNPTDGDLLSLVTADAEANVDNLVLANGTDDYVTHRILDSGTYTIDVITDGTAEIAFVDPVSFTDELTIGSGGDTADAGTIRLKAGDYLGWEATTNECYLTHVDDTGLTCNQALQTGSNGFDGKLTIFSEQGATDYSVVFNPAAAMTQTTTYTLPVDDGTNLQVLHTDGSGVLTWGADDGGNTDYENIGDPGAPGSLTMGAHTGTYTSATDGWGGLIISNTHAGPTSDSTLFSLTYTAADDANSIFTHFQDGTNQTIFKVSSTELITGADDLAYLKITTTDGGGSVLSQTSDGVSSITIGDDTERVIINSPYVDMTFEGEITMRDSDCAANPVDPSFQITMEATDTGDGTEDIDVELLAQVAGTDVKFLDFDADGIFEFHATTDILLDPEGLDVIIGDNAAEDYVLKFDASNADGTITWDQDPGEFDISAGVNVTGKITATTYGSDGTVTDAELLYINSLSSNAQTQISAKEGTLTNSAGLISALNDETGSALAVFSTSPSLTTPIIVDASTLTFDESAADPNDADIALSAADGVFKIASVNGANNEDLTIDLDQTANTAIVTTSTGVTDLNFSAINLITTGTIQGAINIVTTTDGTESPTAAQMNGSFFIADHATAANDTDYTLPTAVAGMCACFYDNGAGDGGIIIDAAASDQILLEGTGVGVADAIDSPGVAGAGANGDFICILAIDATSWITLGSSGTWVDGGAD